MRINIDAIRMAQDLEQKNYFKGLYLLERGVYEKAMRYFRKGIDSGYREHCIKGIIFLYILNNKTDKAKKVYKKYREIFIAADDQIDILYIHFYLGMYHEIYKTRYSLLKEWSLRTCDLQLMIFAIYKFAGYKEAYSYGKYYIKKIKYEMEYTHWDYFLYELSILLGMMGVRKNHYLQCMLTYSPIYI